MKKTVLLAALCLVLLCAKAQTTCDSVSAAFSHTNSGPQYYFFDESVLNNPDDVYWHWNFDDGGDTSNLRNPVHYFYYAGDHQVCLTVDIYLSGTYCQKRACDTITTDGVTGIGELKTQELLLYPNPTAGNCIIETEIGLTAYTVYDALGKVWSNEKLNGYNLTFPPTLPDGIYFVRFENGSNSFIKKILLQR